MSTGAMPNAQWSDTDQMSDETFTGKGCDVAMANKMNPTQEAETRQDSTKND